MGSHPKCVFFSLQTDTKEPFGCPMVCVFRVMKHFMGLHIG